MIIRRKGVPDGGCGMCCRLKQKLDELWQRTSGCILRIRGITPDGQGDFALEAGTNINITEVSNGVRIDTTGGVSYYEPADTYVTIDNDTLKIGVNAGVQDGLATQNDLETVASAVTNIIDGTTQVADAAHADSADNATNAQYLGNNTSNVGSDTKPIKIVNGVAVEVANPLNNEYTTNSQTNISTPSGYVTTDLTSVTVNKGRYIIIGQIDFTSGNGEITGGYQNGSGASIWLVQYNNTVSNYNHLNFAYVIDVTSDSTIVKLQAFSQNSRTVERGTLMLISI